MPERECRYYETGECTARGKNGCNRLPGSEICIETLFEALNKRKENSAEMDGINMIEYIELLQSEICQLKTNLERAMKKPGVQLEEIQQIERKIQLKNDILEIVKQAAKVDGGSESEIK